jgi:hypothetical protein
MPRLLLIVPVLILLTLLCGCQPAPRPELQPVQTLLSPYDNSRGEVLWAVAPLANESGVSLFEPKEITDKLIAATEEIRGVRTVPLNRTLQAMAALQMRGVRSPAEALKLAEALGADGILVGTITTYEPYTPKLGLTVGLYGRGDGMGSEQGATDVRGLRTSTREERPRSRFGTGPLSLVSAHLDGKNHQVQSDVRSYARGRQEGQSALGWKRYLSSMDLFAEFATYHVLDQLIDAEWLRMGRLPDQGISAGTGDAP